jgi:hypothetical protein
MTPIFTAPSLGWLFHAHDEVLDHRVGQEGLGQLLDLGERVVGDLGDLQLEPLALTDLGDPGEPEPRQGAENGLPLRVENLGLGHDVDDNARHGCSVCDEVRNERFAEGRVRGRS